MSSADHWFCARQHGGLCLQSKALLAMHTLLPMGDSVPYCPECDSTIPEADVDEDPLCPMCGTELASDSVAVAAGGVPTPGAASGGGLPHQDSILVALEHSVSACWRLPDASFAVQSIKIFELSPSSPVMVRAEVQVGNLRAEASQAAFGPLLSEPGAEEDSIRASLAVADPTTAHEELRNRILLRGKIVLVERGRCPFAVKAARCTAAGAVAVIVVQTADTFPYTMTDTEGVAAHEGACAPTVMVDRADGARLRSAVGNAALLRRWKRDSACPICREDFVGQRVMLLQCHHVFHEVCLREWFQRSVTCPLCRTSAARTEPTGGDGGDEGAGALYS